jgi:hypothetical protein
MLIIDAHVHIYACFDLSEFIESAFRNFGLAAKEQNIQEFTSIVFLADWSNVSWFEKLETLCSDQKSGKNKAAYRFQVQRTAESESLRVSNENSQEMLIIAGRKVITAENMEVLALCSRDDIADGQTLEKTIRSIVGHGAVPVIPWAVGKWLGYRGKVLDHLMNMAGRPFFYLCDNGNRPFFWRQPDHFDKALKKGIPIISGSDPLHFSAEALRAGNFGCILQGRLSRQTPADDLKKIMLNPNVSIERYGRLERLWPFVVNQARMQLFKKKWRKELLK